MSPVYICYSRNDHAIAEKIRKLLLRKSIPVHDGVDQLSLGMDLAATLTGMIKSCSSVVVILSGSAMQSAWLWKEVEIALDYGKRIIPIQVNQIDTSRLPNSIQQEKILDLENVLSSPDLLVFSLAQLDAQSSGVVVDKMNKISPIQKDGYNSYKEKELGSILDSLDEDRNAGYHRMKKSAPEKRRGRNGTTRSYNRLAWWLIGLELLFVALLVFVLLRWPSFLPFNENSVIVLRKQVFLLQVSIIVAVIVAVGVCLFIILRYNTKLNKAVSNVNLTSDSKVLMKLNEESLVLKKKDPFSFALPLGVHSLNLDYSSLNSPKRINCFIAGSTELQLERDTLRSAISMVYNLWKDQNFQILSATFEDFDRKFTKDGQQPLYDHFITTEADFAVFLIKGHVGDKTKAEFEKAYQAFLANNRPSIVVFSDKFGKDDKSTRAFRKRFAEINQYWVDYKDLNELRYLFQAILSAELWGIYKNDLKP